MRILLSIFCLFYFSSNLQAQSGCTGTLSFEDTVQNQCQTIVGELRIQNTTLDSLAGLENLRKADRVFIRNNSNLVNLDGLKNFVHATQYMEIEANGLSEISLPGLKFANALRIRRENAVTKLDLSALEFAETSVALFASSNVIEVDLSKLSNVGQFSVTGLTRLENLDVSRIQYTQLIRMTSNYSLKTLELSSLIEAGDIEIKDGELEVLTAPRLTKTKKLDLTNLPVLSKAEFPLLSEIREKFVVYNTGLENFSGFGSLSTLGEDKEDSTLIELCKSFPNFPQCQINPGREITFNVTIGNNQELISFEGFRSLVDIKGSIRIYENPRLQSLQGLNILTKIGGSLQIDSNNGDFFFGLQSLNGLENLFEIGGSLIIKENNSLTDISGLSSLGLIRESVKIFDNSSLARTAIFNSGIDWNSITLIPSGNFIQAGSSLFSLS